MRFKVNDRVRFVGRPSKDLPFGLEGTILKLTTIRVTSKEPDCYYVKFDCGIEFSDFSDDELEKI
jgi:hypothetical protein